VVNAGDGRHAHPTQGLLDLYTIRHYKKDFTRLVVGIVGDVLHSRVARSLIHGLTTLGVPEVRVIGPQTLMPLGVEGLHVAIVGDVLHSRVARSLVQALVLMDARVTLVGPPPLLPRGIESLGCQTSTDIGMLAHADVVYVLRMQRERMQEGANYVPSLREYTARWGVTADRLRPGQKVMHPGPMNRGVEIDDAAADAADALIVEQVRSGLVVRMAVLYDLLTHGPVAVEVAAVEEVA